MTKYYEVAISIEVVATYAVEAENEIEAEKKAIRKMSREHDYAQILDSSGAIEEITAEEYNNYI